MDNYNFMIPMPIMGQNKFSGNIDNFRKSHPQELKIMSDTPAVLSIIDKFGTVSHITDKFILTSVQESRQEKAQMIETFGNPAFFFFGERIKIYSFSGHVLETNTTNENYPEKYMWGSSLSELYDTHLRGTALAKNQSYAQLTFKNVVLQGYVLNFNLNHSAQVSDISTFSFSMIITKQSYLRSAKLWYEKYQDVSNKETATF